MKRQQYIVGGNAFIVTAPADLAAWVELAPHYAPFAADTAIEPILQAEVRVMEPQPAEGERIYEPDHADFGLADSRVTRRADGSFTIEFKHVKERKTRVAMTMPRELDRADIVMTPDTAYYDSYFLTHALMIAYMLAASHNGTLLFHASTIVSGGKAYLFQGKSGTGKSTHSALWLSNIPGAELLNDDNPVVRIAADGTPTAYGSPWSGKTDCYRNVAAPIGAFTRIARGGENSFSRLAPLQAYASLTASVFFMPFLSEELQSIRHAAIERLVAAVPCCEMRCRPDADAALTCFRGLNNL